MQITSPAKVNLVLDIVRKRADGFHEVEFVMQELAIHDKLTVESVLENTDVVIQSDDLSVPLDEKNTCYSAVRLMQEEAKKQNSLVQGVKIFIDKRIPSAGGLGGGSGNAAAVIKALNREWNLDLSNNVLKEIAAKIGSDVPFFIEGGTCIATGRGEIIQPIETCPRLEFAFVVPPVKVPALKTKWIYGNFNVANVKDHPSVSRMHDAIKRKNVDAIVSEMGNVFENLTLQEYEPVFALIQELNYLPGVKKAMLAGAGPTVAVVCESAEVAAKIIQPFRARGWVAFATHST